MSHFRLSISDIAEIWRNLFFNLSHLFFDVRLMLRNYIFQELIGMHTIYTKNLDFIYTLLYKRPTGLDRHLRNKTLRYILNLMFSILSLNPNYI